MKTHKKTIRETGRLKKWWKVRGGAWLIHICGAVILLFFAALMTVAITSEILEAWEESKSVVIEFNHGLASIILAYVALAITFAIQASHVYEKKSTQAFNEKTSAALDTLERRLDDSTRGTTSIRTDIEKLQASVNSISRRVPPPVGRSGCP